ncbi:MAG: hypothetical protein ACPL7K_00100 [Armatimonadota bacterium]|jgi:hypothetical protein
MITLVNAQRTGLFDLLGRIWYAASLEQTDYQNRRTLVDNLAAAVIAGATIPAGASQAEFRLSVESLAAARGITDYALRLTRDLVRRAVMADTGRQMSEAEAAAEIVRQMTVTGYYVGSSTVGVVASTDGANTGDAQLLAATLGPDGYTIPLWTPESGDVIFDGAARAYSKEAVELSSVLWPGGTGYKGDTIPVIDLDSGLLRNPALAVADGVITEWLARGTQWTAVLPPQDEIQFSAAPTGGTFRLAFTNRFGVKRYTRDIAYNASPTAVAAEISALDAETRTVRVTARSGGPGYTIDWPYGRYDLPQLQIESALTGATANIVRTRAGTAGGYAGTAVLITGNGSELTGLYQRFTWSRSAVMILVARIWHNGATAGTLQLGIVNGAESTASPITRKSGDGNALSINVASLAANQFHVITCPLAWTDSIDGYVTIRLTSPLTSGKTLVINRPQLIEIPGQTITRPGLLLLANRFGPVVNDRWTWTITNDFAGQVQTWWLRAFADPELALPRSGTNLVPESIISE